MPLAVEDGGLEAWAENVMHLLFPAHRADVERVKAKGTSVCSSCSWSSGCHRCYWPKTCRYWRNKEAEGAFMEGYTGGAKARAKATGKMKAKSMVGGGPAEAS